MYPPVTESAAVCIHDSKSYRVIVKPMIFHIANARKLNALSKTAQVESQTNFVLYTPR